MTVVRHSQPARHPHHKRTHRTPAPAIHRVAAPDVMVPVATQRAGTTSSRDTLLGIAGALLLAFAAAGAAVTMREVRT